MKNYLLGFLLLFILNGLAAQNGGGGSDIFGQVSTPSNGGKVTIYQDPKVRQLVSAHIESSSHSDVIEGYRIQLYSGSSKKAKGDAAAAKAKFLSMFPDISAYLEYNAPFWRVRVGDFRSKNEAMELYSRLKPMFAESYPVKDSQVNYNRIAEPLKDQQ